MKKMKSDEKLMKSDEKWSRFINFSSLLIFFNFSVFC